MNKKFLLLPLIAGLGYLTLTSSSTGYTGANVTGSAGSTVGCAACHGGASAAPAVITLDSAGTVVTKYKPGITYTIKMQGGSLGTTLPKFGFQLSASKSGGIHMGAFSGYAASGYQVQSIGSDSIAMHMSSIAGTTVSGNTVYTVSIPWTAPATGTDTLRLKGVINAVNGNGRDDAADMYSAGSLNVPAWPSTSGVAAINSLEASIAPNPCAGELHINVNGDFTARVYNINGTLVATETTATINTSNWANGLYHVVIAQDGAQKAITVVKQ